MQFRRFAVFVADRFKSPASSTLIAATIPHDIGVRCVSAASGS
jgi:hypothetical protein